MRIGFFLKEAIRAMRRNAAPSFAALATIILTLIVVGVAVPTVQAVRSADNTVRHQVEVDVFFKSSATASTETRVKSEIKGISGVGSVQFVSKEQAFAAGKKADPGAYALISTNPLPDTFHVIPSNPSDALAIRTAILAGGHMIDPSINKVSNHVTDTKKLLQVTGLITFAAIIVCLLFIFASMLLIGNTIRLSLYARRREVEVMKLVGATDWFIRWPFVIEGILVGAAGAMAAIVMLAIAKFAILDPLVGSWTSSLHTTSFVGLVFLLLVAGIGVSGLGSGVALRRFLQV